MKRDMTSISVELLREVIPLPNDYILSGAHYNFRTNCLELTGFSEEFENKVEGARTNIDTGLSYKEAMELKHNVVKCRSP